MLVKDIYMHSPHLQYHLISKIQNSQVRAWGVAVIINSDLWVCIYIDYISSITFLFLIVSSHTSQKHVLNFIINFWI
jgi:hypothetical protein